MNQIDLAKLTNMTSSTELPENFTRADREALRRQYYLDLLPKIPLLPKPNRINRYERTGKYSDIEFLEPLFNQLAAETDPEVCLAICQAIAAAGEDAVMFLLDVMEREDLTDHLRGYAVVALTCNDWVDHLRKMIPYLASKKLAAFVIECLLEAGIAAVPIMIDELSYPDLDVRKWLKTILLELPKTDVLQVLEKYEVLPEEDTLIDMFGADDIRALPGSQSVRRV